MTTDEREDETSEAEDESSTTTSDAALESEAMAADDSSGRDLAERSSDDDDAPAAGAMGTRGFGIERYIQGAYAVLALVLFWIFQQTTVLVWNLFSEPSVAVATGVAAVLAIGGTLALYRHPRFSKLAHEIAVELSMVTWPSRQETQVSTIVVIVTSVVAAIYLGVFDALWSAITDLIYTA